jgi:hypothetical protein
MVGSGWIGAAVGPKGSGKSYWTKIWAKTSKRRLLLFDATGEYKATGKEGIPGLKKFDGLESYFRFVSNGGKAQKCAIRASWRTFNAFCRYGYALGNVDLVVEEVSNYMNEAKSSRGFRDLCDRSRHADIRLLCIASRPANLPSFFRSQVDGWVSFRTSEPTDLDFWRKLQGKEVVDKIRNLKRYEHLNIP